MTADHNTDYSWLREICTDLYYKGYHEGKGDFPNEDDVEISKTQTTIQTRIEAEYVPKSEVLVSVEGGLLHKVGLFTEAELEQRCREARLDELKRADAGIEKVDRVFYVRDRLEQLIPPQPPKDKPEER